MNNRNSWIKIAGTGLIALALAWGAQVAAQQATPDEGAGVEQVNPNYDEATAALDRGEYERAVDLFAEVVNAGAARADAALYWTAYAHQRMGDGGAAANVVARLRREFPESAWLDDADYLMAEVRGAGGQVAEEPRGEDREELRMYALNALMHVEPARAEAILERLLRSDDSIDLRKRALFILLQTESERSFDLVAEIARDSSEPELQRHALRNLGMFGGDRSRALMEEVYAGSTDVEVKESILAGYMMTGWTEKLAQLARNEPVEELRKRAIRHLGQSGGTEELWSIYADESSVEVRETILRSMFATGQQLRLLDIARTEAEPRLRRAALRGLTVMDEGSGTEEIKAGLLEIYRTETDPDIRRTILMGFGMRGDAATLIQLYQEAADDPDSEIRQRIVSALAMVNSDEAVEFLIRIIEQ